MIAPELIRVAPMVIIHPPDRFPDSIPAGSIILPQLPGDVFGDGSHPTTRLSARAVDYWCRVHKPQSLLDVGTGTGILARLARAHGIPFIAATDSDPVALEAARKNASLDKTPIPISITDAAPDFWGSCFDLVIANILESVLRDIASGLITALVPNGTLVISGFTQFQAPFLRSYFSNRGVRFEQAARLDEWALLRFSRVSEA